MKKARTLLFLGTWVVILPYLGFPYFWKNILFTITGLGIIYISYTLYIDNKKRENKEKIFDSFKENEEFVINNEVNENLN